MRKGSVSTLTHDYYWTLQVYGIIIACVTGEEALLQWSMCVYDDGKAAEQDGDSSSDLKYPAPSDFENPSRQIKHTRTLHAVCKAPQDLHAPMPQQLLVAGCHLCGVRLQCR